MFLAIIGLLALPFTLIVSNYWEKFYEDGFWYHDSVEFYRFCSVFFMLNFFLLGWLGGNPVEPFYIIVGLFSTFFYFLFFIFLYKIFLMDKHLYYNVGESYYDINE
jgi:hypothetical protein